MSETISPLSKSDLNLVWLDCEMTGLDPEVDRLIEIAVVVTGPNLEPRVEGPVFVIHQSDAQLDKMDAWNKGTHGRSGLIDKVKASTTTEAEAEAGLIEFIRQYVPKGKAPMCGNSIGQDRRFLVKYMPKLEAFFHYRNLDVSTLKELSRRWKPEVYASFKKAQKHTALADVHESIDELAHYREHFLKL
ncbi:MULTISPECIES: oligoribonuclease [Curvibacter]|jgi:oligoribonuclease|uniref:oligoribonuclease n=1 Tax=Curvibacter TaxID=281915 RepID=UPI00035C8607|nr:MULTISPECIES: oligoribonuclease [Curvibacter]MBV5292069.1 oligoribonuclease [Curvibacter lanceolatus]